MKNYSDFKLAKIFLNKNGLNKFLYIIIILSFLISTVNIVYSKNAINKHDKMGILDLRITNEEFENRKNQFELMQKGIILNFKKKMSLLIIREFFRKDFYFMTDYGKIDYCRKLVEKNIDFYEACHCGGRFEDAIYCKSTSDEILIELDKYVQFNNLIYLFENGDVFIRETTASCMIENPKYPIVDYRYDEKLKKWFILSIRYIIPR